MIQQTEFSLAAKCRGCHLVTHEVLDNLPKPLPKMGMLNLFVKHTSCALSINENADPDVRTDMEKILNRMVKENEPYYDHTLRRCRRYASPRQEFAHRREHYHPYHKWSSELRHMAGNIYLRVPQLRRSAQDSSYYLRIIMN